MQRSQVWRFMAAGFLILIGVVVLLNNLNILPWDITTMQWFWLLVFGGAGVGFLATFFTNRENWWAIIPGFTLLGLAILISDILPGRGEAGGAIFLGMIGLSFVVIYLMRRDFWWAIIPGGALLTLAMVTLVAEIGGTAGGAAFFLGLGITFFLVYFLPNSNGRQRWALWPGFILGIMGLLLTLGAGGIGGYVLPVALILFGGWLVLRNMMNKPPLG